MKFGNFAYGFAKGAAKSFAAKREGTQNIINAGIARASTLGTEMFRKNEEKLNKIKGREEWLDTFLSDLPPQDRQFILGVSDTQWNVWAPKIQARIESGAELPPELIRGEAGAAAVDEVSKVAFSQAAAVLDAPPAIEKSVENSFLRSIRKGFMEAGVFDPSEEYLAQQVRKGAIAVMPELRTTADYDRLFGRQAAAPADQRTDGRSLIPLVDVEAAAAMSRALKEVAPAGAVQVYTQPQINKTIDDNIGVVQDQSFAAQFDAANNRVYGASVSKSAVENISYDVASGIGQIISEMNTTAAGDENRQGALIRDQINAARLPLTTIHTDGYLRKKNIANQQEITEQNLRDAGATETDLQQLLVQNLAAGEVLYGQKPGRLGAILNLAMLNNDTFLNPLHSKISPTDNVVNSLRQYQRAIRDGDISDTLTAEHFVQYFIHFSIDPTDPFASIGEAYADRPVTQENYGPGVE